MQVLLLGVVLQANGVAEQARIKAYFDRLHGLLLQRQEKLTVSIIALIKLRPRSLAR